MYNMIKFENVEVVGWEHAIRGMRNPKNSWAQSDSFEFPPEDDGTPWIGKNDRALMKRLTSAGTDHRKFMRMLVVYVDITAPLYWWKEFDTYKVGTVANSCSTMHKIHAKPFEMDDFSREHLLNGSLFMLRQTVGILNEAREKFIETKEKIYWWQMIQLLPSSYNQKRTVMLNYEVLANIYKSRKNHKLNEWNADCEGSFCRWIETLPYSELITGRKGACNGNQANC